MKRKRYLVRGVVQGVGFRYFCVREAERLHLTGFARNRSDGTVEVEAQGAEELLEQFAQALQNGPRKSRVENVESDNLPLLQSESDFAIR
ncbi:MAG TPA: acylphosphatase [Candidatus Kapabacteria bacterium]|jgi:acylphosphatase